MIVWIVGLSGAGKTTLGRELYAQWKKTDPATVLVDGDEMRAIFGANREPDAFTVVGRRRNAERIVELCRWLDRQRINAVCPLLSIFPDIMAANRQVFSAYFEVFIDVPLEELERRDPKGIYAAAKRGAGADVVGIGIPFPKPSRPDVTLLNNRPDFPVDSLAGEIIEKMRASDRVLRRQN